MKLRPLNKRFDRLHTVESHDYIDPVVDYCAVAAVNVSLWKGLRTASILSARAIMSSWSNYVEKLRVSSDAD